VRQETGWLGDLNGKGAGRGIHRLLLVVSSHAWARSCHAACSKGCLSREPGHSGARVLPLASSRK
jgi:hypothetical protein